MASNELSEPQLQLAVVLKGCAYGLRQPALLVNCTFPLVHGVDWSVIDQSVQQIFAANVLGKGESDAVFSRAYCARLLGLTASLLQRAGLPVFERGRILGARQVSATETVVSLALPYSPGAPIPSFNTMQWVARKLWLCIQGGGKPDDTAAERAELDNLIKQLETLRIPGTNTLRFLAAAQKADIPWMKVFGPHCQFGWGVRQAGAKSSMLDTTSSTGVLLARNKQACAQVLRMAGLPAPVHALAGTLEQAKSIAGQMGFPVVIKPSDLDGGVGVAAGLQNVEQLEQAWSVAVQHSQSILVEKHQPGEDFRLIVLDGRLIWAVGRRPAGVVGDGALTVAQLVERANRDPRRGYHASATLRPLLLDDEASALLVEQGFELSAVPPPGQFVCLRRSANLSSGGTPVVVTDRVHPDNRLLVERAVALLHLDLAGVDLIIPDIQRSWRESGAAIIEINAQPQLIAASQTHLYETILRARVQANGRIPVVVLMGDEQATKSVAEQVRQQLCAVSARLGYADRHGAWVGDQNIARSGLSSFEAGRALLMQRDVEALLLVIDDTSVLTTGLPVDRFDMLVVLDAESSGTAPIDRAWLKQALLLALPHCAGEVLCTSAGAADLEPLRGKRVASALHAVNCSEETVPRVIAHFERELCISSSPRVVH